MKIKAKAFSVFAALTMLLTAAGCSGEKAPVNGSTENPSSRAVSQSEAQSETTEKPETTKVPQTTEKPTVPTTEAKTTAKPTVPQTTEKTAEKPKKPSDKFTLKLYTDKNSKSYKALKAPEMSFKTSIGGVYSDEYMRFVCDSDGVVVTLVELSYNDFRGEFDEGETIFSVKAKKGAVYEFKAYLGETMPPAKLKAEKGSYGAEFVLQMNGKDAKTDFTIKGAKKPK